MPHYTCPACKQVVELEQLTRGKRVDCPLCHGDYISHLDINHAVVQQQYDGMSFVSPKAPPKKKQKPAVQGRSSGAPIRTTWPGPNLHSDVTHVADLQHVTWTSVPSTALRLPYQALDITRGGQMEGVMIHVPELNNQQEAQEHCGEITKFMEANWKATDATEGTGEAAACLAILRETQFSSGHLHLTLAGFSMEWGFHLHSGPGIDQIWSRDNQGTQQYLVVEAKGPGATLSDNKFMPPGFGQMESGWIMHNLHAMLSAGAKDHATGNQGTTQYRGHQLASRILSQLGCTTGTTHPGYGGGSKNYYGVTKYEPHKHLAQLYGVVITASWKPNGMLSYQVSDFQKYDSF